MSKQQTFGDRLKAARISAGLSQEQLAAKVELTRQAISKLEKQPVDPSWTTVQRIVKKLKIDYAELEDPKL